jgi:hypothetical protein
MARRLLSPTSGVIETFAEKLKWQKFIELEQVGIQYERNVHNECELQCLGVVQVADFHLEEVRGVFDEGDHVPFSCHGEYPLVQDFVQNIMRKCPWSQPVMLGRFDYIFVMVHHGLDFLLDGVHKFGDEPDFLTEAPAREHIFWNCSLSNCDAPVSL